MSAVSQVVRDALSFLRVVDAESAPTATQMADGMRALNLMMRRWEADGIALGWVEVTDATQPMPCPPEAEEPITYNLSVRLRSRFGADLDADVIQMATDGLAMLSADVASSTFNRLTYPDLPCGEAQGIPGGWPEGLYS